MLIHINSSGKAQALAISCRSLCCARSSMKFTVRYFSAFQGHKGIAFNDATILPEHANPGRIEFSERTGAPRQDHDVMAVLYCCRLCHFSQVSMITIVVVLGIGACAVRMHNDDPAVRVLHRDIAPLAAHHLAHDARDDVDIMLVPRAA